MQHLQNHLQEHISPEVGLQHRTGNDHSLPLAAIFIIRKFQQRNKLKTSILARHPQSIFHETLHITNPCTTSRSHPIVAVPTTSLMEKDTSKKINTSKRLQKKPLNSTLKVTIKLCQIQPNQNRHNKKRVMS